MRVGPQSSHPPQTLPSDPSLQRGSLFRVEGDPCFEPGEVNSSSCYNFKRGGESPKDFLLSILHPIYLRVPSCYTPSMVAPGENRSENTVVVFSAN